MKRKTHLTKQPKVAIAASSAGRKTHVKITAELKAGKAYIRIVDYIGEYENTSAASIRPRIDEFLAQGVTVCDVYMNTGGGSVFEAAEMVNELLRFGKENVTIYGGSLIASAGTHFTSIFRTILKSNTQFMIHRPKMGTYGDIVSVRADLRLLENKTNEYSQMYSDKTGKTVEEIEQMWQIGDVWMTAMEAKQHGFVEEVEGTEEITEDVVAVLTACGAPEIPDTISKNKNSKQMDRLKLIAMLGLAADATDEQIEAAVQEAKRKQEELAVLTADTQTAKKTKAQALVAKALTAKKITAAEVPYYEAQAITDYDTTATHLEAKQSIPSLSSQLNPQSNDPATLEARKNWTLEDYLDKDPKAYEDLKISNPQLAAALENAYFSKKA